MSDDELKRLLAKMLPEQIGWHPGFAEKLHWLNSNLEGIRDSELLHVCWLIEQTLTDKEFELFAFCLVEQSEFDSRWKSSSLPNSVLRLSSSWQQRTMALAQVKGLL